MYKLTAFSLFFFILSAAVPAAEVPRWTVHEIKLTASGEYKNPALETSAAATFKGPGGIEMKVQAYWDGGASFVIRFTPTAPGPWTWSTVSADAGLNGQRGELVCTAAPAGVRGFMRRDPRAPEHFAWDDGTHFFLMGQTCYKLIEREEKDWRETIDGTAKFGMNKIRFNVPPPKMSDLPDLARWRTLDAIVQYMNQKNMLADFIILGFKPKLQDRGETPEMAERYLRYLIARYAAFPNVVWCVCNEWNYHEKPREYWDRLGKILRADDPWVAEGQALRMLTIHQQTRIDWQFFDQTWPTHVCIQYGVRNKEQNQADEWKRTGKTKYRHGDEWGNAGILLSKGRGLPVVNDEYGYIGEPKDDSVRPVVALTREKHRQIMWGICLAGGYGSTGDKNMYDDGKPYIDAVKWREPAEYQDVKHLVDFFTGRGIQYWNMKPANELVKEGGRVYVLAEPGLRYIVYAAAGGRFALDLPRQPYFVRRFDPRTGETESLSSLSGNTEPPYVFEAPDQQDWVFDLQMMKPNMEAR